MLAQAKADHHAAYQLKLKNELELEEAKQMDDESSELTVSEMRQQLQAEYQKQAQDFINQQLAEKQAQLQAQFDEALNLKVQEALTRHDYDMSENKSEKQLDSAKMGTRKNPVSFGRNITNTISTRFDDNEGSNDSKVGLLFQ